MKIISLRSHAEDKMKKEKRKKKKEKRKEKKKGGEKKCIDRNVKCRKESQK